MLKTSSALRLLLSQTSACRSNKVSQRCLTMYEPEFLDKKPENPMYDRLAIRLQGYDYVLLESYAKYVHRRVRHFGLQSTCYPVPARTKDVHVFKSSTTQISKTFNLSLYERVVEVVNLPSTLAPVLFEVIHTNLPSVVQLTIDRPNKEEEEFRYVPDLTLNQLQSELWQIDRVKEERKWRSQIA